MTTPCDDVTRIPVLSLWIRWCSRWICTLHQHSRSVHTCQYIERCVLYIEHHIARVRRFAYTGAGVVWGENMNTLGAALRALRQERQLSLRGLARQAHVSASLLSEIEHGRVNPSVATLFSIATALEVPAHTLLPGPEIPASSAASARPSTLTGPVVHAADRQHIELTGGVTWARLTSGSLAGAEFLELLYPAGASSGTSMYHHSGREFGLVLEGQLTLELGFEQYVLRPGDSVTFDSTTPHRLSNTG